MKQTLIAILLTLVSLPVFSGIDRQSVVRRNNPEVNSIDSLSSLSVGNGGFAFTVDATGLQTFPEYYENGVPLGTMSDWGWHSFPNTQNYRAEEAFDQKMYSIEKFTDQRRKDAASYLRANPHRLHLGTIGFDIPQEDLVQVKSLGQELDLWEGHLGSAFSYGNNGYFTFTWVHPERDIVYAGYMTDSEKTLAVKFRFPYPTGNHTDSGCDWKPNAQNKTDILRLDSASVLLRRTLDATTYYVSIRWEAPATFTCTADNEFKLTPQQPGIKFSCEYSEEIPQIEAPVSTEAAKELERRVVLSQYLLAVNCAGDTPPQETGLTYNSWFGKYHLEMIWWHQAQFPLWGHPELLERSLNWYFQAEPMARKIAKRQGYQGIRWMKMTDPSAEEAPSKTGSYLIWQQPHLIYLAELLRRAGTDIGRFRPLIEETAEFMLDFARQSTRQGAATYALRGCIPAQETLSAETTVDPPFELAYWQWALKVAGRPMQMDTLAHKDGLYLAAADATDTYTNIKYISDHPAVLGAYGILPDTGLFDKAIMQKTLDWIWDGWNWDKTWGWDYPMVAMCAARLGDRQKAVDALLMPKRTNTYLVSGHNYQDQRLRIYLPGNGGLLTAVALMCAGWDGCKEKNPGFPEGWDVQWEGIKPLP